MHVCQKIESGSFDFVYDVGARYLKNHLERVPEHFLNVAFSVNIATSGSLQSIKVSK